MQKLGYKIEQNYRFSAVISFSSSHLPIKSTTFFNDSILLAQAAAFGENRKSLLQI